MGNPIHLLHLKKAKGLCDILIVSITSDKFINKGYNFIACSLDTIFLMNNIDEYLKKIKR